MAVDADRGTVLIDRGQASMDPRAIGGVISISDAFAANATVRAFVDGSVVELFTSAGRAATVRFYPTSPPPWSLEVLGGATDSVRIWHLGEGQGLLESSLESTLLCS